VAIARECPAAEWATVEVRGVGDRGVVDLDRLAAHRLQPLDRLRIQRRIGGIAEDLGVLRAEDTESEARADGWRRVRLGSDGEDRVGVGAGQREHRCAVEGTGCRDQAYLAEQAGHDERVRAYDDAATAARTATTLAPQFAEGFSALGFALASGKLDMRGARAPFDRSLALAPGDADVLSRYATFASNLRDHARASAVILRAAALDAFARPRAPAR